MKDSNFVERIESMKVICTDRTNIILFWSFVVIYGVGITILAVINFIYLFRRILKLKERCYHLSMFFLFLSAQTAGYLGLVYAYYAHRICKVVTQTDLNLGNKAYFEAQVNEATNDWKRVPILLNLSCSLLYVIFTQWVTTYWYVMMTLPWPGFTIHKYPKLKCRLVRYTAWILLLASFIIDLNQSQFRLYIEFLQPLVGLVLVLILTRTIYAFWVI